MNGITADRISFSAAWTPQDNEVTVVRDVHAGISGPFGSYPATSRAEAAQVLFANGYLTCGDWKIARSGDHWVSLTHMG